MTPVRPERSPRAERFRIIPLCRRASTLSVHGSRLRTRGSVWICTGLPPPHAGRSDTRARVGDRSPRVPGSIGRTDLPGGNHETLLQSVRNVLFPLGDDCVVYPGHGPSTTIGNERRSNPFFIGHG